MTDMTFQWNPEGDTTQEFSLGIVNNSNKDDIESTTFVIENLTPGVPYSLSANVTNIRTNQTTSFESLSENVWIESNLDAISFNKDHAALCSVNTVVENNQISVQITHSLDDPDIRTLFETYRFQYEIFAETANDVQGFLTYELGIADDDEYFPLPGLSSDTSYLLYYSLLVNPNDDQWYYVEAHKPIGNASFSTTDTLRKMESIDDEHLKIAFKRMS